MLNTTVKELFDYVSLGRDIDDFPRDIFPICINGKLYDDSNQIKDLLNKLSNGGLYKSSTENASMEVSTKENEDSYTHNKLITCEDLLKDLNINNE